MHVRDVTARSLAPLGHRVRMLPGVFLDGLRRAAVGIAFAQYRVDGAAERLRVALADFLFLVRLRILRVVWNRITLAPQFLDRAVELVPRPADEIVRE